MAGAVIQRIPHIGWVIAGSLLWRTLIATLLPIGTDEAYEITVGRDFALSFFDHPPLGFWSPAIAEILGASEPLGFRVPTLMFGTLFTVLLYLLGKEIGDERTGFWTAVLGTLAPFTLLSGVIILPDGPLYPALVGSAYALLLLDRGGSQRWWWVAGLALGLAMASKYQAALFGIGALIWVISNPNFKGWFRAPGFYFALLLALLGILPIVWWNTANGWVSFSFHSGRVGNGLQLQNLALMGLGQMGYLLPPVIIWSLLRLVEAKTWRNVRTRLLLMTALPTILCFNAVYVISENSLPHWTMPGWLMLLPLVADWIRQTQRARPWLWGFALPLHVLVLIAVLHLKSGLLTQFTEHLPNWDDTSPNVPLTVSREALQDSGLLQGRDLVAALDWTEGGHLGAILGPEQPIRILADNPHHFMFLPGQKMTGPAALIHVTRVSDQIQETQNQLLSQARKIDPTSKLLGTVLVDRGKRPYFAFIVVGLNFYD